MSEYTLYTDREENFNCEIALEGARLRDSFARIILETSNVSLAFNGTIYSQGRCDIPIKPLRHLLEAKDRGIMKLEVVADDTYFKPWESDFVVDSYKKVEVKINEMTMPSKPKISVSVASQPKKVSKKKKFKKLTIKSIVSELKIDLKKNGIDVKNIKTKKATMSKLVTEYFAKNKINKKYKTKILTKLVESLIRG